MEKRGRTTQATTLVTSSNELKNLRTQLSESSELSCTEYARLNAPRSQILMDIEKDKDFQMVKAYQVLTLKRVIKTYNAGTTKKSEHTIDDCIQLKNDIEYLIRQGKLNKYNKDGNNDNRDNRDYR